MLLSLALLAVGVFVGLLGFKMFRIVLPLVGLVSGAMIGFIGFQGIFGTGAVSTAVAIFVAVAVGLVLGLLSFLFFELSVFIYTALLGASAFSYLAVALGLGSNGFIVFLLWVSGLIIGAMLASSVMFSTNLIILFTSLMGGAFVMASIFLLVGDVSVEQLNENGVVKSVIQVVDQSFIWLFVWIAGSLVAAQAQMRMLAVEVLQDLYQYTPPKHKATK